MSGRIAFVGIHTNSPNITLNASKIALGNITIAGARAEGERSVPRAMTLLSHNSIDIAPLVTHTFPLSDIQ